MTPRSKIQDILGFVFESGINALKSIAFPHEMIHDGNAFFVTYSVADLGAMTSPNDTITLTFTTPNTTKWGHFTFEAKGTSGWRVRMIEAPSGGAAAPTGDLEIYNNERNSANVSGMASIDATAANVSQDATLGTGGDTLIDEYIEGASQGNFTSASQSGQRDEIVLKQNTTYQVSLFGTDNDPGTLKIAWYEKAL